MRSEDLQDALGQVRDSLIEEADAMRVGAYKKKIGARQRALRKANIRSLAAIAACFCIVVTGSIKVGLWNPFGSPKSEMAMDGLGHVATGELEEAGPAEAMEDIKAMEISVWEDSSTQTAQNGADFEGAEKNNDEIKKPDGFDDWAALSSVAYLAGASENAVYSPVNLYSMVALMGSVGSGEQQEAIFDLLQVNNLEELKGQYHEIWELASDQALLANSLWLSNRFSYSEDALQSLSEDMMLSSFIGQMGSSELNQMLQKWVNDHTNNMLKNQVEDVETDYNELLTLVTTLYEKAEWSEPFDSGMTSSGDFHGKNGLCEVEYMHGYRELHYISGKGYAACEIPTKDGGGMWIILPDEDVNVDKLLKDSDVQKILQGNADYLKMEMKSIVLAMPKFDFSNTMYMDMGLAKMGVSNELVPDSKLFQLVETDQENAAIPYELRHTVRVKVDEQGVETAAMSMAKCAGEDEDQVAFYVNRPFLFTMVSEGKVPLCTGVINELK